MRENLKIQSLIEYICIRHLSWWGQLQLVETKRPLKQVWEEIIKKQEMIVVIVPILEKKD